MQSRASHPRRLFARCIDSVIVLAVATIFILVVGKFAVPSLLRLLGSSWVRRAALRAFDLDQLLLGAAELFAAVLLMCALMILGLQYCYDWLCHARWGRTLGKMCCSLRVERHRRGGPPGVLLGLIRASVTLGPAAALIYLNLIDLAVTPSPSHTIPLVAAVLPMAGLLLAFSPSRRTLHDRLSGTVVVSSRGTK